MPNRQLQTTTVLNVDAASAMNMAVVRFLAASGVSQHVIEFNEFKDLVLSIQAAPNAKVGTRQLFSQESRGAGCTWLQMALNEDAERGKNARPRRTKHTQLANTRK
jgi:hypothetical protein